MHRKNVPKTREDDSPCLWERGDGTDGYTVSILQAVLKLSSEGAEPALIVFTHTQDYGHRLYEKLSIAAKGRGLHQKRVRKNHIVICETDVYFHFWDEIPRIPPPRLRSKPVFIDNSVYACVPLQKRLDGVGWLDAMDVRLDFTRKILSRGKDKK